MPGRFSDPFAAVRSLAQRKSGMFDPARERRRVTALERGQRARGGAASWRPETVSEAPSCDDPNYGRGVMVYSDNRTDRLEMCVTNEDGEFESRPIAFANEGLVKGFADSGACNAAQTDNDATALTVQVQLGQEFAWECLLTGSIVGSGDVDIRLTGPATTGWVNAGREATTEAVGNHDHAISGSGNHNHSIADVGAHSHGIANEAAHQHGIANGGAHSHSIPSDGGHSHNTTTNGVHNHGENAKTGYPDKTGVVSHRHGLVAHDGHKHDTNNAGSHNHGGTDSGGSHTHGGGDTGSGGSHNHGGATGGAGGHDHGGATGNGGAHDHGGNTGNAGGHSHAVDTVTGGTVTRVAAITGSETVRLEYRSATNGKRARCHSAALSAICWRVG